MNYGLSSEDLKAIIQEIRRNLGNSKNPKIYIYGSRVKGNFRPFSDVDILLLADDYDESSLSQIDFSELDIPYKVDFVLFKDLYEAYASEVREHMIEL